MATDNPEPNTTSPSPPTPLPRTLALRAIDRLRALQATLTVAEDLSPTDQELMTLLGEHLVSVHKAETKLAAKEGKYRKRMTKQRAKVVRTTKRRYRKKVERRAKARTKKWVRVEWTPGLECVLEEDEVVVVVNRVLERRMVLE